VDEAVAAAQVRVPAGNISAPAGAPNGTEW
jgi:hypothetical protein